MSRPDECRWRDKVAKLEKPCSLLLLIGMPRCAEATAVRLADEASDRQRRRKNKNGHSFPLFPSHFSRLVTKFSPSSVSLNLLFDLCSLSDRTPVILIAIEALRRALFTDEFSLHKNFHFFHQLVSLTFHSKIFLGRLSASYNPSSISTNPTTSIWLHRQSVAGY